MAKYMTKILDVEQIKDQVKKLRGKLEPFAIIPL